MQAASETRVSALGLQQTFWSGEPFATHFLPSELPHHLQPPYSVVFCITTRDLLPVSFKPTPAPQRVHLCQLVPQVISVKGAPGMTVHLCASAPPRRHCPEPNPGCQASHTDQDPAREAPRRSKEGLSCVAVRHGTDRVASSV